MDIFSEQDHPKFLLQEKGQSRGTESSERGSVHHLRDLRLLATYFSHVSTNG